MQQVLIVGCGYAGERLARLHRARGDIVTGTTRDTARAAALRAREITPLVVDADGALPSLPRVDRVYYTVPPAPSGDADARLERLLNALVPPAVFVYFGTTGVYGDRGGERVDERTPPAPATARARRRLAAESRVMEWCAARPCRSVILRIAGIYGPGRLPLARLAAGEPVPDPATAGPGNRVHVDDLVAAAMAIADSGADGIWNISDGNPLSTAEFSEQVAAAAGLPPPRRVALDSGEISPGLREFLAERRFVDNGKLLQLAGFRLRYPDPVAAIRDILSE